MENDIRALVLTLLLSVAAAPRAGAQADLRLEPVMDTPTAELARKFRTPPGEAGMSCYWWWLNGHTTEEAITRDLEEMKAKGYGSASLIDAGGFNPVTARPGPGEVFLSEGWKRLYRHAVREADRLGITLSVNATSGWNPGGPFVTPERALKRLTYSETDVRGGGRVEVELPQPPTWYVCRDICVQAVRKAPEGAPMKDAAIPHWSAKAFYSGLGFQEIFPLGLLSAGFDHDAGAEPLRGEEILDITSCFDGRKLVWDAPEGEWTVIRYAWTCTGARTSTTSDGWEGLSLDHLDPEAFALYRDSVLLPLIRTAKEAGNSVRFLLTDSWEMGLVNWTERFPEEFRRFRGYDLWRYLPVMTGRVVESPEVSNRFLQDVRRTVSDCILNYHYKPFRELANAHGMMTDPEAGGPCYTPVDALEVLGACDIPHGEFWARATSHVASEGARLSVRQSACVAHTNGRRFVEAEGPTSIGPHWERSPKELKGLLDRVFCSGVNRLVWHTFTSSPAEWGRPGVEYFAGTHLNRNVTWWEQAGDFVGYIDRCSYLLQQGLFVADVLIYNGDDVPNMVFLKEEEAGFPFGYDWDKCSKSVVLERLSVAGDGRIVLPDGMSYRVLVLPPLETIDLDVMRRIERMVLDGMTLVGDPPKRTTGLAHYPDGDRELKEITDRMWRCDMGGWMDGVNRTENRYGRGRVIRGQELGNVLTALGAPPDFAYTGADPRTRLDFIHRTTDDQEIYFVANRFARQGIDDYFYRYLPRPYDRFEQVECRFRVTGRAPQFWNPLTGEIEPVRYYCERDGYTCIPMHFAPEGSCFVVFPKDVPPVRHIVRADRRTEPLFLSQSVVPRYPAIGFADDGGTLCADLYEPGEYTLYWSDGGVSHVAAERLPAETELTDPWTVRFDPAWGPACPVRFDSLRSWTEFDDPQIRYYSGTATYEKEFTMDRAQLRGRKVLLDLGNVQEVAVIRLNGHEFPVSWSDPCEADITRWVRPGTNRLSVDVVNLWPNRLIGDGKLPPGERRTRSNVSKYDAADAEKYLRVSGLLGPVRIRCFERVRIDGSK